MINDVPSTTFFSFSVINFKFIPFPSAVNLYADEFENDHATI